MAFKELPRIQRLAILIGVPVAICFVSGYLSWGTLGKLGPDPRLAKARLLQRTTKGSMREKIVALAQQTKSEEAVAAQGPAKKKELDGLQDKIARLQRQFPSEREKPEMRALIQNMASSVPSEVGKVLFIGLSINEGRKTSTSRRGGRGGAAYTEVTYRCNLEADMNGLIYYVNRIESHPRFMTVRSLQVSPGQVAIDREKMVIEYLPHRVSMEIVTYIYEGGVNG